MKKIKTYTKTYIGQYLKNHRLILYSWPLFFAAFFIHFFNRWLSSNFGKTVSFDTLYSFFTGNNADLVVNMIFPSHYYYNLLNHMLRAVVVSMLVVLLLVLIKSLLLYLYQRSHKRSQHRKQHHQQNRSQQRLQKKFLTIARFNMIFLCVVYLLAVGLFVRYGNSFSRSLNAKGFFENNFAVDTNVPDYFAQYYKNPKDVAITPPANKKNLIIIVVESMEEGHRDYRFFGNNPKDAAMQSFAPYERTGLQLKLNEVATAINTRGITLAMQCGLHDTWNSNQYKKIFAFLPNATCLFDILKTHGYRTALMKGATGKFADARSFYNSHSTDETYFREEFDALGYGEEKFIHDHWGVYDKFLFKEAHRVLTDLHKGFKIRQQPFAFYMLTLNMHAPADAYCLRENPVPRAERYKKILDCSADLITNFLRDAEKNNLLENTQVLIMGDNRPWPDPLVDSKKWRAMFPDGYIYNLWLDKSKKPFRQHFTHYDLFPSILEYAGFKVAGGQLGFGYSVFQPAADYPATITDWEDRLNKVAGYSLTYFDLWKK